MPSARTNSAKLSEDVDCPVTAFTEVATMFVSVIHRISDPDGYFKMVAKEAGNLPSDLRLPQNVTGGDRRTMICLWEAPSVERLKAVLEPLTQGMSKNEYIQIDTSLSNGLPAATVV
jgi:hypothetical protein